MFRLTTGSTVFYCTAGVPAAFTAPPEDAALCAPQGAAPGKARKNRERPRFRPRKIRLRGKQYLFRTIPLSQNAPGQTPRQKAGNKSRPFVEPQAETGRNQAAGFTAKAFTRAFSRLLYRDAVFA